MQNKQTVNDYIAKSHGDAKEALVKVRFLIKQLVTTPYIETISYGVPTIKINGKNVMHFGAFRDHLSLYPASDEMISQIPALAPHRTGKGTIQFSFNEEIDYKLVNQAIKYWLTRS